MSDSDYSPRELQNTPPLTAENLARDFGIRSALSKQCLANFSAAIARDNDIYSQWQPIYRQLWQSAENRLLSPLEKLMHKFGLAGVHPHSRPLHFLFALQSYYALVLSLLIKRFDPLRNYELIDPVFAWCLDSPSPQLRAVVEQVAAEMAKYRVSGGNDLLKILHHSLFPRALRHPLGEYYTPDWLAEHLLDQLEFDGRPPIRLLDPACGSGTFLMAAIRRIRRALLSKKAPPSPALPRTDSSADSILAQISKCVVGIDLNPLSVMAAKANYLIAVQDLLPDTNPPNIPVYCGDSILGLETDKTHPRLSEPSFDCIVGNPPWIAWDNLPGDYREATKPLWEKYGLFSLSANAARHGGAKKDLSMLMLYVAADRYLKHGGRLGFIITQTLFQTKGAGDGFRRFCLGPDSTLQENLLHVLRVDDLAALKPFDDAANWTSAIVLEKGAATTYPVPYVRWEPTPNALLANQKSKERTPTPSFKKIPCTAAPIDPFRPTSPWLIQPAENAAGPSLFLAPSASDYRAHLGANSGGANGVYWVELLGADTHGVRIRNVVEKCKKAIESVEAVIEPDLLYPLLRWSDLARFAPLPRYCLLVVQDFERRVGLEETSLKQRLPLTYAYLQRFAPLLAFRAAYRRYQGKQPFYSMYNVGPYTAADCKVVWRRMDKRLNAAALEPIDHPFLGRRPVVPQETCSLVACRSIEESHYLCAMLNSEPADRLIRSHSVRGGKGFGTPSILDYLPIRKFDPANSSHHELASASQEAHRLALENRSLHKQQTLIDRLANIAFKISYPTPCE